MSVTLNGTQVTGGGTALDLESVPTIINKNAQYNVTKTVGLLKITLKQRGIFSMLELEVPTIENNIDYLELVEALKELGIHIKKAGNPFYFILNFKAINYIKYNKMGYEFEDPSFDFVTKNYISLSASPYGYAFNSIFGISKLEANSIYRIIGYWTDDDNF